jgi:hypothetical protein
MPYRTLMKEPTRMPLSRRQLLALLGASSLGAAIPASADTLPEVVIHKGPSCGCCNGWAEHVRRAGFPVRLVESRNIDAVKQRLGVPTDLASCHTAEVGGYVIEGHVPAGAIQRVLGERPPAVGLAVPAMPTGSPGMEGGTPETYEVVLFGEQGRRVFARYQGVREI